MGKFNVDDYVNVQERILEFYQDFSEGEIKTLMHEHEDVVIFEARVFKTAQATKDNVFTSGFAREVEGVSNVNKTSHLENCETSAIGRALANMGYATSAQRPSRSEMMKVARMNKEMSNFVEYIKAQGPKLPEDYEVDIDGTTQNLRKYILDNWGEIKDKYTEARKILVIVEKAPDIQKYPAWLKDSGLATDE